MSEIFLPLGVIALASIIASLVSVKLRIPSVIGLIIVGIIIGPYGLSFVKESELISAFSELGGILLLFLIGTEFSLSKIKKLGLESIIVAAIELGIVFFITYNASLMLGFDKGSSLFIGIIFSITSTALIVRILQEMGLGNREEISLLVGVSVIEDVFAVFALGFVSSLAIGKSLAIEFIMLSALKSMIILFASFYIFTKISPRFIEIARNLKSEVIDIFGFSLVMIMSFISVTLGLSPAVGAFVAGSIVSALPQGKEIEKSIKNFGLLFVSLFFLSIGMLVNPVNIINNVTLISFFLLIAIFGKFLGISLGTFMAGYSSKSAVFSGLSMIPLGEISLLITLSGVSAGILSHDFLGIVASVVLITSIISYPAIKYNETIYRIINRLVPKRAKNIGITLSTGFHFYRRLLSPEGRIFRVMETEWAKILLHIIATISSIILIFLFRIYVIEDTIFYFLSAVLILFSIYNLYKTWNHIVKAFRRFYSPDSSRSRYYEIQKELNVALILLILALYISPLAEHLTNLPISLVIFGILIFIVVDIFWDIDIGLKKIGRNIFKKRYRYKVKTRRH